MSMSSRRSAPSARSSLREREFNSSIAGKNSKNFTTEKKFVIGVDFGTTFTYVSYFFHPINERHPRTFPEQLLSIKNWPDDLSSGDAGGTRPQVPSETWYSPIPLSRETPQDTDDQDGTLDEFVYADKSHPLTFAENANPESSGDESSEFLWSYQVHHQQYRENISRNTGNRVKRSKLHLVPTAYTHDDRVELLRSMEILIENGIIRKHGSKDEPDARDVLDIFTDFLVKVLNHTKDQLIQLHNFSSQSVVEFALTVPTIWSPNASRILQTALQTAARLVKFGHISTKKVVIPYIVSEPEAAALYMLAGNSSVQPRETFIIADCGGGTVDIVTYEMGTEHPLRLSEEKVTPGGNNCGSSYLNENWKNMLLNKLKDESYLLDMWPAGESLESIVNRFIPNFENDHKRRKDVASLFGLKTRLHLPGLKENAEKRFDDGHIVIIKSKVFLLGEFGASPSLRSYLRNYLREMSNKPEVGCDIELMTGNDASGYPVTAVSCGAVLAALNKNNGPARRAQSSYGIFRKELYQPTVLGLEAHRNCTARNCSIDNQDYLYVVNYFVFKGSLIPPRHRFEPWISIHTFPEEYETWICEELIYVSDRTKYSHYPLEHENNKDAQIAGRLEFDMTFLKTQKKIPLAERRYGETKLAKPHYCVELEISAELNGMLLEYSARYPPGVGGKIMSRGQVCVSAAFAPGCA
ncbi:hypothetical protein BOTNAR_0390g00090 [Botryotinia narcissicola]|uniref:Uncharacterized protein n=1 Tax=Botryotinia narcissicola TaxID=278944 RepID=A0A4Z1HP80_9HELO|nr:hypothetical protein BOTNAR_0390g00090 [Botryotinia narcissicola]